MTGFFYFFLPPSASSRQIRTQVTAQRPPSPGFRLRQGYGGLDGAPRSLAPPSWGESRRRQGAAWRVGVAGQHALTQLIEAKHALTRLALFTEIGGMTAAPGSESLLSGFGAAVGGKLHHAVWSCGTRAPAPYSIRESDAPAANGLSGVAQCP